MSMLEQARALVRELAGQAGLLEEHVTVLGRPLTPEEAIGEPGRRDYPIILGKERILEAQLPAGRGHAFTDSAQEIASTVREALDLELADDSRRAITIATMNAVMRQLGRVSATVHCKDEEPEQCGAAIAEQLYAEHPAGTVGLIGFNPAIAEALARRFGAERARVSDRWAGNVGARRFGVEIWGSDRSSELIEDVDVVLVTGTTLVNDTFDAIWLSCQQSKTRCVVFGVTGAAVCQVLGLERLCALGH